MLENKKSFFFALGIIIIAIGSISSINAATQTDIIGPPGSGRFGNQVTVLSNGNIVVSDPSYDSGPINDVGAVYLYDGQTLALISVLTGSTALDRVGSGGSDGRSITELPNGNFVVRSPFWNGVGAATLCNGTTGCTGTVSAANSIVGNTPGLRLSSFMSVLTNGNYIVGGFGVQTFCNGTTGCTGIVSSTNSLIGGPINITELANGNYVAGSTFCNGTTGCTGIVSAANSLIPSGFSVHALPNGNYVVRNPFWDNGSLENAGAVTFCDGTTGCTGEVSAANSLIGTTADDRVGDDGFADGGVRILPNENYIVYSRGWDNGSTPNVGAVTYCDGVTGCTGTVSAANSLIGNSAHDNVGNGPNTVLTNGNYVVGSFEGTTFCNGTIGCTGTFSAANSLIGGGRITALMNGNYVVSSSDWDNGSIENVGAVTFCDGTTGCTGIVSAANSLIGSSAGDAVGGVTTPLSNGNYVVNSQVWNNIGAVTLCNGVTGCTGEVSSKNSLVGASETFIDESGFPVAKHSFVTELTNGNYVVQSPEWDKGQKEKVGAVTFCKGTTGCTGPVSARNSLIGSTTKDFVGGNGTSVTGYLIILPNGNYVLRSPFWDDGSIANVGAVTFCNGTTGCTGEISATNSLIGSTADDRVGGTSFFPAGVTLANGNYVVRSPNWDNGSLTNSGAITYGDGVVGTVGEINSANSVIGTVPHVGGGLSFSLNTINDQIVVGRQFENIVSIFGYSTPTPRRQIHDLKDAVQNLFEAGNLTENQASNLKAKLDGAQDKIALGQTDKAINKLEDFINEVEKLVNSGKLTTAQAQPLIDAAQAVIDELNAGS